METDVKDLGTDFYQEDEILVIHLENELDHHNAMIIREKVDECIIKGGVKYVIFDFAHTNFMDSSGIGVIMGRQKIVESIGGKVYVRNMNKEIKRIFMISGLHKLVQQVESEVLSEA